MGAQKREEGSRGEVSERGLSPSDEFRQLVTGRTEFKFEFEIGRLASGESVLDKTEKTKKLVMEKDKTPNGSFSKFCADSLARHCLCNWGDVSQEQKDANNQALKAGGQLFSTYMHDEHPTICILTQADRSETVIGFPEGFSEEFEED